MSAQPVAKPGARGRLRPGSALGRVLLAPGLVLGLWALQLVAAKLLAGPARAAARASMGPWTYLLDGHLLRAASELTQLQPGVAAALGATVLSSLAFGAVFWLLLSPAPLARFAGERSPTWLLVACARNLPAMLVQTVYSLVLRALCLALAGFGLLELGAPWIPVAALLAAFPVLVLDRARAAVVLEDQRPLHIMTFLRAIPHVARRPLWWLFGTLLELLKLGVAVATVLLVFAAGPAPSAIWVARAAGLVTMLLGLWRIGLAAEDSVRRGPGPAPEPAPPADPRAELPS